MMTKEDSTVFEPQRVAFGDPLVDIHHHVIPPGYLDALARLGMDTSAFPSWAPEESLKVMDRLGIGRAMLSLSSPGVWFGDDSKARSLARACNEYVAGLRKERRNRFGGLAVLPLPDLKGARQELTHALDSLNLDGVILFSNVEGRYVGDPELDALMADLHELKATVLLHPNDVPTTDENAPLYPWAEYPIDLARAWSRLVYRQILVRYPGIRWTLTHAGGVVPFMAERLGKVHYLKKEKPRWGRIILDLARKRDGGLELARGVSYDTVGAANPVTLAALRRFVGPDGIRFGSNFPWDSEQSVEASLRFLEGTGGTPLLGSVPGEPERVE